MKKYRLFRSLLALALAAGLTLPTALAAQSAPPEATPAVVTPKAPVESQLLSDMHIEAAAAILVDADTAPCSSIRMPMSSAILPASPRS